MAKIVAIVQARLGSTRFPRKMLECLDGYPLLSWVLHRLSRSTLIDEVVLATSDLSKDDDLLPIANELEFRYFVVVNLMYWTGSLAPH